MLYVLHSYILQQGKLITTMKDFRVNSPLPNIFFFILKNNFSFGGKDLQHKSFTLEKSFLVTLYGMILKGWFVTPTKLSPRLVFIT